jgi:hypothetical protein
MMQIFTEKSQEIGSINSSSIKWVTSGKLETQTELHIALYLQATLRNVIQSTHEEGKKNDIFAIIGRGEWMSSCSRDIIRRFASAFRDE